MMFEFSHDLLPVLLSISLYMTFAGAHLIPYLARESIYNNRYIAQKQLDSWQKQEVPETMLADHLAERQTWITRIMKRKEGPEDDSDYSSFSNATITNIEEDYDGKIICGHEI